MHPHPPEPNEYAPYYSKYISLVKSDDLVETLASQARATCALLGGLTEEQGNSRYEPGKWSVKEVLGHVNDTERIFSYRALRIGRNDPRPIEGYEQDDYVRYGSFDRCRLSDLLEEFQSVRQSTLLLFKKFDQEAWLRRGVANQNEVSVRALGYIIAGHELHHRAILQEKYLNA
jgi:uncharacterized damage-inducible protein DinB